MVDAYPFLTLFPPLLAIALVILTKKVLFSLGVGILTGALLVAGANPLNASGVIWNAIAGLLWADGAVNWYTFLILAFLLELGVLTSLVLMSGGTYAFTRWASRHVRSRRSSQVLTAALGMAIFIDDYFNALAVGQVARPLTDRNQVSRAKLSYLIDSSSAPVSVLAPFSSWGASIIGIMAPILAASSLTMSEVEAFIRSAMLNYYAIGALVLVAFVVLWQIDFGPMRREEDRAVSGGGVIADTEDIPGQLSDNLPRNEPGAMRALIVPFVVLVVGAVGSMFITGALASGSWSILEAMANADVALALNVGGILGLASALWYLWRYTQDNPEFTSSVRLKGSLEGAKSMLPAIWILLMAWVLGAIISDLGTGNYLASLVSQAHVPVHWLVPLMFVIAAGMAFSTGTSWGSFGILLPLAGEIVNAVPASGDVLLAAFGAVLAGAVFGDHCSPISDTTILSATGAACPLTLHVNTQLPYALVGAGAATLGYVTYAATDSGVLGLVVTVAVIAAVCVALKVARPTVLEEQAAA